MSILEDMYYADLEEPQRPAMYWQEMHDVDKRTSLVYNKLFAELNDSQKKLLDDLEKLLTEKSMIDARYSFRFGFRYATRILTEALAEN